MKYSLVFGCLAVASIYTVAALQYVRWGTRRVELASQIELVFSNEPGVSEEAAGAIGRLGPDAAEAAVDQLLLRSDTPDPFTRFRALEAVGVIRPTHPKVIPALRAALDDPDWSVRITAVKALARISRHDPAALPSLQSALTSRCESVRAKAAVALLRSDSTHRQANHVVVQTLQGAGAHARACVLLELATIPSPGMALVKQLELALQDADDEVRAAAACGLEKVGARSSRSVEALTDALRDPCMYVRIHAAQALGERRGHARSAIPELGKLVETDPSGLSREIAAQAIRDIETSDH
jgi:HEAT repeat protein